MATKEENKRWRKKNPNYQKEWKKQHPGYSKATYQKHKKYYQNYRDTHQDYYKYYGKKYQKENREELNEKERQKKRWIFPEYKIHKGIYWKQKKKVDVKFHLNCNISTMICNSLRGKKSGRTWETLVGYVLQDLITHLERQFDKNMSWDNYGSYWHIDHIKPKSLFNYIYPEDQEFQECWALKNLQPLERIANMKKGNSYIS